MKSEFINRLFLTQVGFEINLGFCIYRICTVINTNVLSKLWSLSNGLKDGIYSCKIVINYIFLPVKINFLDKFCRLLLVPMIVITPFESRAEQMDATFWFSYGFGAGLSGTLCDQVDAGMISNVEAKMFTSNFEESLEDPESAASFDLEALTQGFNDVVPEFDNCNIKLYWFLKLIL